MRHRLILVAAVVLTLAGGTALASATPAGWSGDAHRDPAASAPGTAHGGQAGALPEPTPPEPAAGHVTSPPAPGPHWRIDPAAEIDVDVDGFLAWAALDRTTGTRVGSANATDTSSTESMIKIWIVADHLRRAAEAGTAPTGGELQDARTAIRHSDNSAAQRLYESGGQDEVVRRMIDVCGLADSYIPPDGSGWWSRTQMSPADAVRLGECVADGTAAGPGWTDWLLAEMRQVEGTTADADQRPEEDFEGGRWGVIDGLPASMPATGVAIKNGWTRIGADSSWHLNCLAVADSWVIAVMMRYPADYRLDYGAQVCAEVTRQLFTDRSP